MGLVRWLLLIGVVSCGVFGIPVTRTTLPSRLRCITVVVRMLLESV
jgi:hypothetical protein